MTRTTAIITRFHELHAAGFDRETAMRMAEEQTPAAPASVRLAHALVNYTDDRQAEMAAQSQRDLRDARGGR